MLTNIARLVATQAHAGQVRKYTSEPYINHPERVSAWLAQFHVGELIEAAALCHDVIEDCNVTHNTLSMLVDMPVADLVLEVTNGVYPAGTPRIQKYWGNIIKLLMASHQAQTLKCGDIYDNCKDVYDHDPAYAARYIAEKFFLVRLFTRAQSDVRRATLDLLSLVYNSMNDSHKIYCLEYIQQISRECPKEMDERLNALLLEANTFIDDKTIGDYYGTETAAV